MEEHMTDEEFDSLAEKIVRETQRRVPGCDYDFGIWIEDEKGRRERVRIKISFLTNKIEE